MQTSLEYSLVLSGLTIRNAAMCQVLRFVCAAFGSGKMDRVDLFLLHDLSCLAIRLYPWNFLRNPGFREIVLQLLLFYNRFVLKLLISCGARLRQGLSLCWVALNANDFDIGVFDISFVGNRVIVSSSNIHLFNKIIQPAMRIFLLVILCYTSLSLPISNFLNSRLIVRKNCEWTIRRIERKESLLSSFFGEREGQCLYALGKSDSSLHLVLELKEKGLGELREIILNIKLPSNVGYAQYRAKIGKELTLSFKDPHSEVLFSQSKSFTKQMQGTDAILSLSARKEKLSLNLPGLIIFEFELDRSESSYNEELVLLWLVFIYLNYQWFYFNKNEGLILREYRSIKKGWCFKTVSVFWINHTTFPINLHHQYQKFAEYLKENESEMLQIGVLLVLMGAIVMFIGFQMSKLMKKVSFFSREQLHVREVVDNILILVVLVTPFKYLLIVMPAAKLLQIWHLLTLEESHYISYYQQYGKIFFDWLEGLYFTLYANNFAELPPNYIAAAFILTISLIQLTIFLMQLFSYQQFEELRAIATGISEKLQNFYKKTQAKRAEIDSCSICLESFSSSGCLEVVDQAEHQTFECTTIAVTRCDHKFHASCLEKWFRDGNENCPLDRHNLKRIRRTSV